MKRRLNTPRVCEDGGNGLSEGMVRKCMCGHMC